MNRNKLDMRDADIERILRFNDKLRTGDTYPIMKKVCIAVYCDLIAECSGSKFKIGDD